MSQPTYPGMSNEANPEPFVTIPPQSTQPKPGQLSQAQIKQFFEDGFVVVPDFFTAEELNPVKEDINKMVDDLANVLFDAGKIKDLHSNKGFDDRLIEIEKEYPGANILFHKTGYLPQSIRDVWTNERILNVMEQLLGTQEIKGHPVWNIRPKVPRNNASTVPWHQDVAYLDKRSYKVLQVSGWIPLLDTNANNGCCQTVTGLVVAHWTMDKHVHCSVSSSMVRGGHVTGRVARHTGCWKDTWFVMLDEEEMHNTLGVNVMTDIVTCPVPFGGILLFNNLIPHRSLNNTVDDVTRWTIDLRWQRNELPVGFHDINEGVQFRSADPNFKVDFSNFECGTFKKGIENQKKNGEMDTTICGPWILNWELVNDNRHTLATKQSKSTTSYHVKVDE